MRAFLFCLAALLAAFPDSASAQMKLSPKAAAGANEARYFTTLDGLMDGNADVVLKEIRQGRNLSSAVFDVCYPAEKGSDRKDRFVVNLAVNGQSLTGATQSLGDKLPVTVKLARRPTGDTFEFKGQISIGPTVVEVTSSENSDLSEKEFQDTQSTDDGITAAPRDFTEVSPEAIGVKVKLDVALDFLKGLKGQDLEVSLNSLGVSCDALRAGEQTININVDPERAAALIAKFRSMPGVIAAGWTSGVIDLERSIRFAAADWRDGDRLNRDRLATIITNVLARTFAAKSAAAAWNVNTGKLKLTFKRPSRTYPALDLTETIEVTALVAADRPGISDRLMLWIGNPVISTTDEGAGPKLNLIEESSADEEGDPKDDSGSVDALAKEFKGERWDTNKSSWK
jgi:hypothetical protein